MDDPLIRPKEILMAPKTIVPFPINPSIDTEVGGEGIIPDPSFAGANMGNGRIGGCIPKNRINRRKKSHDSKDR